MILVARDQVPKTSDVVWAWVIGDALVGRVNIFLILNGRDLQTRRILSTQDIKPAQKTPAQSTKERYTVDIFSRERANTAQLSFAHKISGRISFDLDKIRPVLSQVFNGLRELRPNQQKFTQNFER
jgi:hypothetical protein